MENTWYMFFVAKNERDCLVNHFTQEELKNGLVVCANTQNGKPKRLFNRFSNVDKFMEYIQRIPIEKWHFFEYILGFQKQKLYFDIDIKEPKPNVVKDLLDYLVNAIKLVLAKKDVNILLSKDILIFSSNSKDGSRYSYHVILDNYYLDNNEENKSLAMEILSMIPQHLNYYIDNSMYSQKQQLRMLYSSKVNSGRVKIHVSNWEHCGLIINQNIPANELFRRSCVTVTDYCTKINNIVFEVKCIDNTHKKLLSSVFEKIKSSELFRIYEVDKREGNLICLRRKCPGMCTICNRVHEHENAYLVVRSDGGVYFYCRRNNNKNKLIAVLDEISDEEALNISMDNMTIVSAPLLEQEAIAMISKGSTCLKNILKQEHSIPRQSDLHSRKRELYNLTDSPRRQIFEVNYSNS
jgi:hypothetical protein